MSEDGGASAQRRVLLLAHTGRERTRRAAERVAGLLAEAGLQPLVLDDQATDLPGCAQVERVGAGAVGEVELVLVLGGDGTVLRAAELARGARVPVLGVDTGHVAFLVDTEPDDLPATLAAVAERRYDVEERMTLDVELTTPDGATWRSWALNDVSVEKADRQRVLSVVTEVDGRPVSSFGGDGVVVATPTGSTAYAFSAGGPVVWPDVQALVLAPISAHALFARPLVTSPASVLAVETDAASGADGVLWCDGRRSADVPAGSRVVVRRGAEPVLLARTSTGVFTDRLVAKFALPVTGWRGPGGSAGT